MIGTVSLGCSKNQVDLERLLATLRAAGYALSGNVDECDAVIINTCGFIEDAKRESIDLILEFSARKGTGRLRAVVVTGCLAERYREELAKEIPEVDVVLGIGCNGGIVDALDKALGGEKVQLYGDKQDLSLEGGRILVNAPYFAYLKVAEGCNNRCSYCAIPDIRGPFRSRKMEDCVGEARELAAAGVRELNVVAQDSTRYGEDLYGEFRLAELLEALCEIDGLHWIRILYCYPQRITEKLLDVMREQPKIVKYMDVPVQHCDGRVLSAMNRRGDREELTALMRHIREQIPGVTLRTTLITGFPGETDGEYEQLCEFVKDVRFERLGCFPYSREEDTPAYAMAPQVDEEVKRRRADQLMELQLPIARAHSERLVGEALEVLCEGYDDEAKLWYGRGAADAPDIDTKVFFTADRDVEPGEFVQVRVLDALDWDVVGEMEEA